MSLLVCLVLLLIRGIYLFIYSFFMLYFDVVWTLVLLKFLIFVFEFFGFLFNIFQFLLYCCISTLDLVSSACLLHFLSYLSFCS